MIPFTKAHACGNDFLIVTEEAAADCDWANLARRLCARHTGIGADGMEFFAWTGPKAGRIRLHNADGSMAEISGNGTRCVAAWMAAGSQSRATTRPESPSRSASARLCPPPPSVPSTSTAPGRGSSQRSTSSNITGTWIG